jgi:hypothetical protein
MKQLLINVGIVMAACFSSCHLKKYCDVVKRLDQSSFLEDTYNASVSVHVRGVDGFSICCEYVAHLDNVSKEKADSFIIVKTKEAEIVKYEVDSVLQLNN